MLDEFMDPVSYKKSPVLLKDRVEVSKKNNLSCKNIHLSYRDYDHPS